ncbi:hypothetical protein AXG93_1231s1100 [Marchantia polymorpha subsp. ruderalis]|uniref:Uncharacterized protein n=1 Tax=Marchantia polymorpha subsp. ruderalis TaxID=1480154 RepID=A0A176VQS9_MARPO|nr:hypothetical protein AXG93_1231s1100 [Marchantia polymorpha subsp. ruderalis]
MGLSGTGIIAPRRVEAEETRVKGERDASKSCPGEIGRTIDIWTAEIGGLRTSGSSTGGDSTRRTRVLRRVAGGKPWALESRLLRVPGGHTRRPMATRAEPSDGERTTPCFALVSRDDYISDTRAFLPGLEGGGRREGERRPRKGSRTDEVVDSCGGVEGGLTPVLDGINHGADRRVPRASPASWFADSLILRHRACLYGKTLADLDSQWEIEAHRSDRGPK